MTKAEESKMDTLILVDVLDRMRAEDDERYSAAAARRAAKEAHEAQFIALPGLCEAVRTRHTLMHSQSREVVFKVLRADMTPLFCRWGAWRDWTDGRDERDWHPDEARWTPLPPCPVVCFYRLDEGTGTNWGQCYTYANDCGCFTSSDPLATALGVDLTNRVQFLAAALAIRVEDAERLFGLRGATNSESTKTDLAPASGAVRVTEMTPVDVPSAVPKLSRAAWKKPGSNHWTEEAKREMRTMREKHTDREIATAFGLKEPRQVGNLIGSRCANKSKATDAKYK